MAFTSVSKAGMRARMTLLDLTYLCHADTSAGSDKGPKVKVLWGREPCTHSVSSQAITPGWGSKEQGAIVLAPIHPPATTKPLQLCPFQSSLSLQRRILEIPPFFMQPLLQNGVFFQVKAREKPVVPHVKTDRPHTDIQRPLEKSLKNVGMEYKLKQRCFWHFCQFLNWDFFQL